MRKIRIAIAASAALVLIAAFHLYSQTQQTAPTIKVDVDLVLVNATVTDREGRYVTGLAKNYFDIYEDKVQQNIQYFSAEDAPVSVGIIFDASGSMQSVLPMSHNAAVTFLKSGSPQDEYFLLEFNDRAHVTVDFTSDISKIENHLLFLPAKGSTALYDALYMGLDKVKQGINPKKALLLISDGGENHSRYTLANLKDFAREKDVQLYIIGIGGEYRAEGGGLAALAEMTGGRSFNARENVGFDLEDICSKIAVELKNQYIIGYRSTNESKDGKWRKIQVKVKTPPGLTTLSVRSKTGYYAAALPGTPR